MHFAPKTDILTACLLSVCNIRHRDHFLGNAKAKIVVTTGVCTVQ
jgi:hypothetical protein